MHSWPIRLLPRLLACAAIPVLVVCVSTLSSGQGRSDPGDATPPDILVSRQLAAFEGLALGDIVRLSSDPSGGDARAFRIVGTYEPTPDPMRVTTARLEARLHLPDLLALTADPTDPLSTESVNAINVSLTDADDVRGFARDLHTKVPGLIIRPTARDAGPSSPFAVIERFHLAVAVVTVIASSLFLLALMVMRVEERRETVGLLRLIGVKRHRVLLNVLVEGLLITIGGAVFGIVLAVGLEDVINWFFQRRYDTSLVFVRITPTVTWRSVALVVPMGMLASAAASWALLRRSVLSLVRR